MKKIIFHSLKNSAIGSFLAIIVLLLISTFDDGFYNSVVKELLEYFSYFFVAFFIGFVAARKVSNTYFGILTTTVLTFAIIYSLNKVTTDSFFSSSITLEINSAVAIVTSLLTYLLSRNKTASKKVKLGAIALPFTNAFLLFLIVMALYTVIFIKAFGNPYKETSKFLFDILFVDSIIVFIVTFILFKLIYQYIKRRSVAIYAYYFLIFTFYSVSCFFKYYSLGEGAMNIQNFLSYLLIRIPFIFLIIAVVQISYLIQYAKSEKKQLLQLSLESQLNYQQLKNQLSPHFLFNNLNVLTSLIEENPEKAIDFSKNLSHIYRYFLEQEKHDVVLVENEIRFAKSYLELLKDRFENGLNFSLIVDENSKQKYIVSTVLQQVLENVIKHNTINETSLVEVTVTSTEDYLIIQNNKKPKAEIKQESKKGIENIKSRIAFFTDQEVIINESEKQYLIKIPILEIEE